MKCNVSKSGQAFRLLVGMTLIAWAVAGGPAWTWVGLVVTATGTWRLCPVLMLLGVRPVETDSIHAKDDSRHRDSASQDS